MSLKRYANSSIGRKQITALTGLMLIGFLVAHLSGNFLLFAGLGEFNLEQAKIVANIGSEVKADLSKKNDLPAVADVKNFDDKSIDNQTIPINQYAHKLKSLGPILWMMRLGLLFIFMLHFLMFIQTTTLNKFARPVPYALKKSAGGETLSSTTMVYTGVILFAYILLHLADLTFNFFQTSSIYHGVDCGLFGIIVNGFKNPIHSGLYIFAMLILGLHLTHAVQSACQTFGINHPRYTPQIKKASKAIAAVIALGYISIPVFVYIAL